MSQRIAVTGSTGLVGSKLIPFLLNNNYEVTQITRRSSLAEDKRTPFIVWNPDAGQIDSLRLEGIDTVIHLAGANVGERWTDDYKKVILNSRINSTKLIAKTLAGLTKKPKLLISASAIGFYANHPAEVILDESNTAGQSFLADVCKRWEEETKPASDAGIRVVHLRIGVVLHKSGGALAKMWMPFQLGIGGVLGTGRQMMSWIALDEIPLIIEHIIKNESIVGPVNVTSPKPVTNKEFTKTLGQIIKRPTLFPVPDFGIKLLFGEMGQTLLLEGNRVLPKRLLESGYQFKYPDIKTALEKAVN